MRDELRVAEGDMARSKVQGTSFCQAVMCTKQRIYLEKTSMKCIVVDYNKYIYQTSGSTLTYNMFIS